jgi:hypothetical protein
MDTVSILIAKDFRLSNPHESTLNPNNPKPIENSRRLSGLTIQDWTAPGPNSTLGNEKINQTRNGRVAFDLTVLPTANSAVYPCRSACYPNKKEE